MQLSEHILQIINKIWGRARQNFKIKIGIENISLNQSDGLKHFLQIAANLISNSQVSKQSGGQKRHFLFFQIGFKFFPLTLAHTPPAQKNLPQRAQLNTKKGEAKFSHL